MGLFSNPNDLRCACGDRGYIDPKAMPAGDDRRMQRHRKQTGCSGRYLHARLLSAHCVTCGRSA